MMLRFRAIVAAYETVYIRIEQDTTWLIHSADRFPNFPSLNHTYWSELRQWRQQQQQVRSREQILFSNWREKERGHWTHNYSCWSHPTTHFHNNFTQINNDWPRFIYFHKSWCLIMFSWHLEARLWRVWSRALWLCTSVRGLKYLDRITLITLLFQNIFYIEAY